MITYRIYFSNMNYAITVSHGIVVVAPLIAEWMIFEKFMTVVQYVQRKRGKLVQERRQ